jgi:hypothetical protein
VLKALDEELNHFVELVVNHRPKALKGKSIAELFPIAERAPARLRALHRQWQASPGLTKSAAPTLVFAVYGQAKFDMCVNANEENELLTQQLRSWAYNRN